MLGLFSIFINMAKNLFIDVETFSSEDIAAAGAYKYIESPDFEILIVSYAFDNAPIICIDLASGEELPEEFEEALFDESIVKHAHNATFERLCFKRIGYNVPVEQWECTAVKSAYCGLAFSLDQVSKILDIENKKLDTGKLLIKYFSCPCKPTKINGLRTRNYYYHDPTKWQMYKDYNIMDVEAEREIYNLLKNYDWPSIERRLYNLDQKINDFGIRLDLQFAQSCITIDESYRSILTEAVINKIGVANPNSDMQIKNWILEQTGETVESLAKPAMPKVIEQFKGNTLVSYVLKARNQLSKSSIKKYTAMLNCAGQDLRARGLFQFYGANRTGRWAGRLIQLQNLPQNHIDLLAYVRQLAADGDTESIDMLYGNVPSILSQLIRTAFVAKPGYTFVVADFSAIEARVISWYAGEQWRLDVFNTHGKIYEATAARMFNLPVSMITKGSDLRQKGKVAELALGYGGSVGALARMGGEQMGLSKSEMRDIVKKWRQANPSIVDFWSDLEECAKTAITWPGRLVISAFKDLTFYSDSEYLQIRLPNGRSLFYRKPRLKPVKFGRTVIYYEGLNQETKAWGLVDTYGGKLAENIVQATARDLLGHSMLKIDEAGYPIVMHVHDEVVCEVPKDEADAIFKGLIQIMGTQVYWAPGLPLKADGYITDFYKKD